VRREDHRILLVKNDSVPSNKMNWCKFTSKNPLVRHEEQIKNCQVSTSETRFEPNGIIMGLDGNVGEKCQNRKKRFL
jgi:hypothetical protein